MGQELKTPLEWSKEFHVVIAEPIGWLDSDFHKPISREEFHFRLTRSIATTQTVPPPCR